MSAPTHEISDANLNKALNPDALEVAPGTVHEKLEGWVPELAGEDAVRDALEKAFDYRGDVTITTKSGERIEERHREVGPALRVAGEAPAPVRRRARLYRGGPRAGSGDRRRAGGRTVGTAAQLPRDVGDQENIRHKKRVFAARGRRRREISVLIPFSVSR